MIALIALIAFKITLQMHDINGDEHISIQVARLSTVIFNATGLKLAMIQLSVSIDESLHSLSTFHRNTIQLPRAVSHPNIDIQYLYIYMYVFYQIGSLKNCLFEKEAKFD